MSSAAEQQDWPLPPLRRDLQIQPGSPTPDGAPTWTIHDPIANQFFQIGWQSFHMLSRWTAGTVRRLIDAVSSSTTCAISQHDVKTLLTFLYANHLTLHPPPGAEHSYAAQAEARRTRWWSWLVHHYLFFRIPLVHPQRFLTNSLPYVRLCYTQTARWIVCLAALLGLALVGRQWDAFLHTFFSLFNMQGIVAYAVALSAIKVFHELGHAYTATRYGCRIPVMGVAFLVLFPVLYTDTTDAWRLRSTRQRLNIAAAGTLVELAIATIATLAWVYLAPGTLRSIAFIVATSSWVMSVTINLNPLMKFDGYYMLSDWLGVPNLQSRAFALGTWKLRRLLFGAGESPPELLSSSLRTQLIAYAWATWVYRFFLFLGIALLVYHFFFKLLGITLFVFEIFWFIALPVFREFKQWWTMRHTFTASSRIWMLGGAILAGLLLLGLPWTTRVSMPAVLKSADQALLFAPADAQIRAVHVDVGDRVERGQTLLTLTSPPLEHDITLLAKRIELAEIKLARHASSPGELSERHIRQEALAALLAERDGKLEAQQQLVLRAPIAGRVTMLEPSLNAGRWVSHTLQLATIVPDQPVEVHALARDEDIVRLEHAQPATFFADDLNQRSLSLRIADIQHVDEPQLTIPYLASTFGGDVAVRQDAQGILHTEEALYRIRLQPHHENREVRQVLRGTVHVTGKPQSPITRLWEWTTAVLIRESGF